MEKEVLDEFQKVDARFEAVDRRFDAMDRKFDAMFTYMQSQFELIMDKFDAFSDRQGRADIRTAEVQDHIDSIERAVDKDAVTIIDHEGRITKLEAA